MSSKKSKGRRAQRIQELEMKKRSGLIQAIAAIVIMVVLIIIKTTFASAGTEWANSQIANMAIFACAIVAAGFAGYGSRRWNRARKELDALSSGRK